MGTTKTRLKPDTIIDLHPLTALQAVLWDRRVGEMRADELLWLYEDRWRYLDPDAMSETEQRVVTALVRDVGNGVFLD